MHTSTGIITYIIHIYIEIWPHKRKGGREKNSCMLHKYTLEIPSWYHKKKNWKGLHKSNTRESDA